MTLPLSTYDSGRSAPACQIILLILCTHLHAQTPPLRSEDTKNAPSVQLRLRTGGAIEGALLDYNDHGLVILHGDNPYVFGWLEIEPRSACLAHRTAVAASKGGRQHLDAEDHFRLGVFELARHRKDFASDSFTEAARRDSSYHEKNRRAITEYKEKLKGNADEAASGSESDEGAEPDVPTPNSHLPGSNASNGRPDPFPMLVPQPSPENREKILEVYRTFGAKVQELLDARLVLLETDHFLIWTDWEERERERLVNWCEGMFDALRRQLNIPADESVFLAKCPVFCFRSAPSFHQFARQFDGYDVRDAIGYTRSIASSGHVHIVLLRQGQKPHDFDRFACTLAHEGTHAFLHRLYSTTLIPHWVNEGYAELIAAQVMGERCPGDGNATLLAQQYVKRNWPISDFIQGVGPIAVYHYALAHSLVRFLHERGPDRWAGFIRGLKSGQTVAEALRQNYEEMTLEQMEVLWREHITLSKMADETK